MLKYNIIPKKFSILLYLTLVILKEKWFLTIKIICLSVQAILIGTSYSGKLQKSVFKINLFFKCTIVSL